MPMNASSPGPYNKANIFLGLIEYELNSLQGANYISVHIRFNLERYLLNIDTIMGAVTNFNRQKTLTAVTKTHQINLDLDQIHV